MFAELEISAVVNLSNNNNETGEVTGEVTDVVEKRKSFADMKLAHITNSSYHNSQVAFDWITSFPY